MADHGLLTTWGAPVRGREKKSLEVFGEALAFYEKAKSNGEIDDYSVGLIQPPAGLGVGGFIIAQGTEAQIDAFTRTDDYVSLVNRATLIVEEMATNRFLTGDRLAARVQQYSRDMEGIV